MYSRFTLRIEMDIKKTVLIGLIAIGMFGLLSKLFGGGADADTVRTALENGGQLVDVRTEGEFRSGTAKGAINIPLDRIQQGSSKLKKDKTVVVFCRSGNRSSQAKSILEAQGFKVINGGTVQAIQAVQ